MKYRKHQDKGYTTTPTSFSTLYRSCFAILFVTAMITFGLLVDTATATDRFFRAEGLTGHATEENHIGWSNLTAYRNVFKPTKAELCKVVIDKDIDTMSPTLWINAISKIPLVNSEIELVRSGNEPRNVYFRVLMPEALIKKITYTNASEELEEFPEGMDQERIVLIPTQSFNVTYMMFDDGGSPIGEISEEIDCR